MRTYTAKPKDIKMKWYLVDADGHVLGRLATFIADTLRGKLKPTFTPHMDTGDYVVVINAEKIVLTGNKLKQKTHFTHSGYPGGDKLITYDKLMAKRPDQVIRFAVKRMLPQNKLSEKIINKLKVYRGSDHPHQAQKLEVLKPVA